MLRFKQFLSEGKRYDYDNLKRHGYFYHATPHENLESIRKHGLKGKVMKGHDGQDVKFLNNFSYHRSGPDGAKGYGGDSGVLLRVHHSKLTHPYHDPISRYVRTEDDVPPEHLEYEHKPGKWKKLR